MAIHYDFGGNCTCVDDADPSRTATIAAGADQEAQILAFFGPNMTLPDPFPMHRLRLFLHATNQFARVKNYLNSLPEPNKTYANSEFEYAPNFVPTSAFGMAAKAALGFNDADYAQAMREASQATVEDYGSPRPSLLAAITKFFVGA